MVTVIRSAVVAAVLTGTLAASAATAFAETHTASAPTTSSFRVAVADYTLGDTAFRTRGAYNRNGDPKSGEAPIELTGRVYYPQTHSRQARPMAIMLHGLWWTCADRPAGLLFDQAEALENAWGAAHPPTGTPTRDHKPQGTPNPDQAKLDQISDAAAAKLDRWPCATGTPALPSYTGYDYLGRSLAAHGITTVSISANGVNAVDLGSTEARANLINKHLALWAALDRTGGGPLAGHFTAAGTSQPVHPDFRHTIDLQRVGTLGHSRGGKAVFWQAADAHAAAVPSGVRIAAAVSLAPAGAPEFEQGPAEARNFVVTRVPVLLWEGTCDFATGDEGDEYVQGNAGYAHQPYYRVLVHGANHNFLNTQWSPSSGQVEATDEVDTLGVPRPVPGQCTHSNGNSEPELSEATERATSQAYVTDFFLRELLGQRQQQPVLDGTVKPLGRRVTVDVHVFSGSGHPA